MAFSDFVDDIGSLSASAANIFSIANSGATSSSTNIAPTPAVSGTTTNPATMKWLIYGGIAVAIAVIGWFFLGRKKKRK